MRRLDLIIQTEGLETFLEKVLECSCDYCPYYNYDKECESIEPCYKNVMEYLTQEMVIDFEEIADRIYCDNTPCEECDLNGKRGCKTLFLWDRFGKVL